MNTKNQTNLIVIGKYERLKKKKKKKTLSWAVCLPERLIAYCTHIYYINLL